MQFIFDIDGFLYAIRVWRLVIYIDKKHKTLRFGGIVTNIGIASFLFWRFSWVMYENQ